MATSGTPPSLHNHRVVVGVDAVLSLRSEDPDVAIVAFVDESAPAEILLAQTAGADVVLPGPRGGPCAGRYPHLDLAIHAATTAAARRRSLAESSRRVRHDMAQALNLIALTAEAGRERRIDAEQAFDQIRALVSETEPEAWEAGRGWRSASLVIARIELRQWLEGGFLPSDVAVALPDDDTVVLADEERLTGAVSELMDNARRAGAGRIWIDVIETFEGAAGGRVDIVVCDDGRGFPTDVAVDIGRPFITGPESRRLGLGLATIAEAMNDVGGRLVVLDTGTGSTPTRVSLSLPSLAGRSSERVDDAAPIDQATTQASILEAVVRHAPLQESLEAIVAAIERQLPGATCSVLLLHQDRCLRHGAGARLPASYRSAIDGLAIGTGQGSCGTAAATGRPVVTSDITTDHNWIDYRDLAGEHRLRSCWSTPILAAADGRVLGTFAVYKSTVWRPDQAAMRLVRRFTHLAAIAIEHHRLFAALAESEARFRRAFEGAAAGIALADLDGTILKLNPALSRIVGCSSGDLVGTNLLDLVEVADRAVLTETWRRIGRDRSPPSDDPIEVRVATAVDDPPRWLSMHTSLIADESGRSPYLYIEVRDVTAARHHRAEQQARQAAEAASMAKTEFLALASHELRTPLNAILGFAQVMQIVDMDNEQRTDSVDQIVNAGRHLRDLIDELLDLSRIDSGQLVMSSEPVDVLRVVDEAVDLVRPLAAARQIELVDPGIREPSPCALGDHRCLRQVLINLLDNAVKYTPVGGRVEVGVEPVVGSGIRISVADSGPGISSASLKAVFEPFHRLDTVAGSERTGSGLGLALCQRMMREMDGAIGVDSSVGSGSTFWVELPWSGPAQDPAEDGAASPIPVAELPAPGSPASVLYVEDDAACVEVMKAAFDLRPELSLTAANTAANGMDLLIARSIDLVLLDVGLPDRSGWDLLAEIRVRWPHLPVVVLTAGAECVPVGVPAPDRIFVKPVDVVEVIRAIDPQGRRPTGCHDLGQTVDTFNQ